MAQSSKSLTTKKPPTLEAVAVTVPIRIALDKGSKASFFDLMADLADEPIHITIPRRTRAGRLRNLCLKIGGPHPA